MFKTPMKGAIVELGGKEAGWGNVHGELERRRFISCRAFSLTLMRSLLKLIICMPWEVSP